MNHASIKDILSLIKEKLAGEEKLIEVFENCFINTLDTTIKKLEDRTTYVITGDIPAMWLRDSTCQLRPYLVLAKQEEEIADLISGLVERQFQYINIDPYANAFNEQPNGNCWRNDNTDMGDWIWERKYEVDSLCYPIQLAYLLWKNAERTQHFNNTFQEGIKKILEIWHIEQDHEHKSNYRFERENTFFTDTLSRDGKGALVKSNIGLTWSGFRPSDDACIYGYLIPSNMFAVVVLGYLEEIEKEVFNDTILAGQAKLLKEEIQEGIETYGVTKLENYGEVYAYEIDGYGQYNLMDDANVPSLLAMDYIGYKGRKTQVAENTKRFILSEANPYFYKGKVAEGIGSSHTPARYIWPIALGMQGLTTSDKEEQRRILEILVNTDGEKKAMHEGFDVDNPKNYTREWFSWANAVFSELVLKYCGYEIIV